jgi:hypothetical protein
MEDHLWILLLVLPLGPMALWLLVDRRPDLIIPPDPKKYKKYRARSSGSGGGDGSDGGCGGD